MPLKMTHKILLLVMLSMNVLSCKKANYEGYPINAPVAIRLTQFMPGAGKAELMLHCTSGHFAESDYQLNYQSAINGNNIAISFTDITKQNVSVYRYSGKQPGAGPALADVHLGNLAAGSYQLTIHLGSATYNNTLVVSDTDCRVPLSFTGSSVAFASTYIKRLRGNTIWGTATGTNDSSWSDINTLIDSLVFYGAKPYTGPVGDYGLFHNDSGFSYQPLGSSFPEKQFIYTWTGSVNNINNVVENYYRNHYQSPTSPYQLYMQLNVYTIENNYVFFIPPMPVYAHL
jgi:hypothetical protein